MQVNPLQTKSKDQIQSKNQSKKKKKNKQKKEKHQNLMKQLPATCFSCSAHENQFLKISPKPTKTAPICKSCGFKLDGKYGYLTCSKTNNCFNLCSTCKICSKNHILRNVISLKQYTDNELYAQNKFKCHGCKQQKIIHDVKGAYHCNPCSFTICYECMQKTDKLWENLDKPEQ